MDWEEDSSQHIIQPASSPWRKRSYDTYNDPTESCYTHGSYPAYRVTDTLRNLPELGAPFVDPEGRPAHYVQGPDGRPMLQAIIQPEPRQPIGYYLPEWLKWVIYGTALLVFTSVQLADDAGQYSATVAVHVGNSAKRRLVEVTRRAFAPTPSPRQRRHGHRRTHIIRRISPTSPGGRTHIPVTPPRARPRATLSEAAVADYDCLVDYVPSNIQHVRSGAFVASAEDDHLMSGITYHPYFEPLMSGALQDAEMDEDDLSSVTTSPSSPYHIPGNFPDTPATPRLPSTESPTSELQASDDLAIPQEIETKDLATPDEQAVDEVGTPHSKASDRPSVPDVQPTITFPLQQIDSRPRNYKGELLDDWQIKVCKQFQAIHPPPRESRQQAVSVPEKLQGPRSSGLIELHRSPLAKGSPTTPHQQHGTTTTGSIDSRWSPMVSVSETGAADGAMDWHESTTGTLDQPKGMASIGLNDLHRSPLDLQRATAEVLHYPHVQTPIGLNDLHRSPLDLHRATAKDLHQPIAPTSIGSNDLHRSPLADAPPKIAGVIPNDSYDTASDTIHQLSRTATTGSIDLPRSPLADVSPNHLQPGSSPSMATDSQGSLLAASSLEPAVGALSDTHEAGPNIPYHKGSATTIPLRSPPTSLSAMMTTAPAKLPSKWSFRSLYSRIQGKPKHRSPLCERINNGNVRKLPPKTPKRVTWPENGPVTGTKHFVKHRAIFHPSPTSSREDSSILSSVPSDFSPQPSPTMQEEEEEEEEEAASNPPYQAYPPTSSGGDRSMSPISSSESMVLDLGSTIERTDAVQKPGEEPALNPGSSSDNEARDNPVETPTKTTAADPSTPPSQLFPKLEELTISTRRSSLRRREKEDQAKKLRETLAAEEKARKDREEAEAKARKDKEEAEGKARKDKEEAEEKARIKTEEEEERKRTGGRRIPMERVIESLPPGWEEKVRINMAKGMREQLAMTSVGNPLTRRDFGMVLPQSGTGDDPIGWLNDEIISGYLQAVVDHGHRAMGHPRGAKPRMHAFSPFFYTTLKERGYDAVKRWSNRAKIGGNDLKNVEYVFIPCNPSRSHWTLVVVSPVRKTIEVFDSMHGASSDKVNTTKAWLRGELGSSYIDSEWLVVEDPIYPGRGKGPLQNNSSDCGVFAVTTAKMLVLGVDPMAVSAQDMPLQRRRLVAELLNGGFSGEFEPRVVFE